MKRYQFKQDNVPTQETPTHYLYLVDVSGSMYSDLPKLRESFKNKLSTSLQQKDKLTIIYYSTNGQYGYLLKNYTYEGIQSLNQAQGAIDKLQTIGLTGFVDPLKLAVSLMRETKEDFHLVFMSDGYENQNPISKVLDIAKQAGELASKTTIVEYGYYANHKLLLDMAATMQGAHVHNQNFQDYDMLVDQVFKVSVTPKQKLSISNVNPTDIVFAVDWNNGEIISLDNSGEYFLDPRMEVIHLFEIDGEITDADVLYGAMYISFLNDNHASFYKLLRRSGDVHLIDEYQNAIGKQRVLEYLSLLKDCVFDETMRHSMGENQNYAPREDAFCLFDLIEMLQNDSTALIYPRHDAFNYERIGRKTVYQNEDQIHFNYSDGPNVGVPISSIVLNKNRANISVNVKYDGYIEYDQMKIDTHIFRSYTIMKDGIMNVDVLPLSFSKEVFEKLYNERLIRPKEKNYIQNGIYEVYIGDLPVINQERRKSLSAQQFAQTYLKLIHAQAEQKVLKGITNELAPKEDGLLAHFSDEVKEELKKQGLTKGGFNPPVKIAESVDYYIAPYFDLKIKGMANLPSYNALRKSIEKGKIPNSQVLLKEAYDHYEKEQDLTRLFDALSDANKRVDHLSNEYGMLVITHLLSKNKFNDLPDDDVAHISFEDKDFSVKFEETEKEIKI